MLFLDQYLFTFMSIKILNYNDISFYKIINFYVFHSCLSILCMYRYNFLDLFLYLVKQMVSKRTKLLSTAKLFSAPVPKTLLSLKI